MDARCRLRGRAWRGADTPLQGRLAVALALLGGFAARAVDAAERPSMAVVTVDSPSAMQGYFEGYFASFGVVSETPLPSTLTFTPADDAQGCAAYQMPSGVSTAIAVVRRGSCTFVRKTVLAQQAGASSVVIVSDTDEPMLMGGVGDNATAEERTEAAGINIAAVAVAKNVGDRIIEWNAGHGRSEAVGLSFKVYQLPSFDVSSVIVVLLATSLVVAGAFFSTSDLRTGSPFAARRDEVLEVDNTLAVGFCIMGSIMLVVLFFFMKFMIYVIIFAFCVGGFSCIVQLGGAALQHLFPGLRHRVCVLPEVGPVTTGDLIATVPASLLVLGWLLYRNTSHGFIFQDILGAGFLCMMQRTLRLPNIKVATVLLVVMFFFDIFWVFISPLFFTESVMVKVAKGGGTGEMVPMLLRVPAIGDPFGSDRMLGFGDVALPGLLISYLLRHDILSKKRGCSGYFVHGVIGYFMGLCVTIVALIIMRMGQPALLYLVPGTLGTTLLLGYCRGDLRNLWDGTPCGQGCAGVCDPSRVAFDGRELMLGTETAVGAEIQNLTEDDGDRQV